MFPSCIRADQLGLIDARKRSVSGRFRLTVRVVNVQARESMRALTFPVKPNSKHPAIRAFQRIEQPVTLRDHSQNTGMVTGPSSGIVVIDLDRKNGIDGLVSLTALGPPAPTATVVTPSGGLHLWYATDEPIQNSTSKLGPGIDVRGKGGYVVIPPSQIDGIPYRWLTTCEPQPLPRWLFWQLVISSLDRRILEGERNDRLFRIACALRARGAPANEILERLTVLNGTCDPPLDLGELDQIAESAARYGASGTRVEVQYRAHHFSLMHEIIGHLSDKPVYQRNNKLVRIIANEQARHMPDGQPTIAEYDLPSFRMLVNQHIKLMHTDARTGIPSERPASADLCASILAHKEYPGVRPLSGLMDTPLILQSGAVVSAPGYDPGTGFFLTLSSEFPPVPSHPTQADACQALNALRYPFSEFQWASGNDLDTCVSYLLTLLLRPTLRASVPLFVFDGSTSGCGKTYAAHAAHIIATGRMPGFATWTSDDEENRKLLNAYALAGINALLFDNVDQDHDISGAALDALLTSELASFRILGKTEAVTVAAFFTIACTGNNVKVKGDTCRRALAPRMVSTMSNPEARKGFRIPDLYQWAKDYRGNMVSAAHTLVRAYVYAGSPMMPQIPTWGGFNPWIRRVASPIVWAGGNDPTRTRVQRLSDGRSTDLANMYSAWFKVMGNAPASVRMLKALITTPPFVELAQCIGELTGYTMPFQADRAMPKLTAILGHSRDRIIEGYALRASVEQGQRLWSVVKVK